VIASTTASGRAEYPEPGWPLPAPKNLDAVLPRKLGEGETMNVAMGASGNTGKIVAEKLLAAGKKVRVIGRHADRLKTLTQRGAEPAIADASDIAGLTKAFAGATAVYAMIPPNISAPDVSAYSQRVSDAIVSAIRTNGITHAVVLSSTGADKTEKTGPVVGLHNLEKKLEAVAGLNALFLRAGYFMENLLPQAGIIRSFGNMAGPLKAELTLRMIATRDIGAFAAEALLKLNFSVKRSRELDGPHDVAYAGIARIIGEAIGKPDLKYLHLPAAQLKPVLVQMGMSQNMADLLLEMSDALNSGYMRALEPRSAENSTSTTLETFVAEVFVPAYRGIATHA
jgi:uncharacterized protein YbjT (DUF2867 family)